MTSPQPGAELQPNPEVVNEFHRYADTDNSDASAHHTLGIDPNQASPGDHNHDGRNSSFITGLSDAVQKAGDTMSGLLTLIKGLKLSGSDIEGARWTGTNFLVQDVQPTIEFQDTDQPVGGGQAYWLHANSGQFYLLQDRNDVGIWEAPHPFFIDRTGQLRLGFSPSQTDSATTKAYVDNGLAGKLGTTETAANSTRLAGQGLDAGPNANTVVSRDGAGDVHARLLRSTWGGDATVADPFILAQNARGANTDNYARPTLLSTIRDRLRVMSWAFTQRTIIIRNSGVDRAWHNANFEIQDVDSPRISFHQPGQVASQIGQHNDSEALRTFNNPGTGYASFYAAGLFDHDRRVMVHPGGSGGHVVQNGRQAVSSGGAVAHDIPMSFPVAFGMVPHMATTAYSLSYYVTNVSSVSTTGFTARCRAARDTETLGNWEFSWIATG